MLAVEKAKRQKELEDIIFKLSERLLEDETDIKKVTIDLVKLYQNNFRHNYSGVFPIIVKIAKDDTPYNIDYLSNNLETLRSFVESDHVSGKNEFTSLYYNLEKLCDHLNLEIGRWSYYSQNEHKIEDIEVKNRTLNEEMQSTVTKLDEANKKADSMQTDIIAVLSIFSGIVISFSGGFTLLGSVMTAVNEAVHYEAVVLVAIISGMVIFNTIFLLMYLVGKITDRNIYARCKSKECSCENPCKGIKKIQKRLPYIFYFNLICVIGIVIDCLVWYFDIRNWLYL